MMDDLHNNINVYHKGRKISIAQHWDSPSDRVEYDDAYGMLFDTTAAVQEVGIIPDDGDWGSMHIEKFGKSLDNLILVLKGIRDEIDYKIHNESSGESDARTAQTATGSTT